jgi:hypothetical protein
LRVLTAGMLVTDAVIHVQLAGRYDLNATGGLSQGDLFRIESGVAVLAAGLILVTAHRAAWAVALVTTASAAVAVLVSRYVEIGQLGPVPDMFEPYWYGQKVVAALAEAVGTVAAVVGLIRRPHTQADTSSAGP